jgi:RNA polymerase sigma factor (sigma-70 family)
VDKLLDEMVRGLQRQWSDEGFIALWQRLKKKREYLLRRRRIRDMDDEDLEQELMVDLVKGVQTWQPEKGCNAGSWIDLRWKSRLNTLLLRAMNLGNKALTVAMSANDPMLDLNDEHAGEQRDEESCPAAYDDAPQRDRVAEYRWRLAVLHRDLTRRESLVVMWYRRGVPLREIAVKLGCSEKAVDNSLRRVRQKHKSLARGDWQHLSLDDCRQRK